MNRLVLIDGNAILHRAYHALPPLTAPDGSVVNAVYGFTSILIKLFKELKPTHMAVAFDRPEPTFRKSLFKEYQAKRPEMDDALVTQIPKVQDVVRAFGMPIYDAVGFEADDVIGTIVKQVISDKQKEISKTNKHSDVSPITSRLSPSIEDVVIVTGDRDILQLVDDKKGVKVFMPTKGLSEGKLLGEKDVEEKMGVMPDRIPDLKALMGDASDNYPGVAGIGPKTAVGLLHTFGSIEELYKAMKSQPSAVSLQPSAGIREKLLQGEESAKFSKDLATIRTNAPVDFEENHAQIETLDTLDARTKLAEFHFPSLIKRLTNTKEDRKEKVEKSTKKIEKGMEQGSQQQLF